MNQLTPAVPPKQITRLESIDGDLSAIAGATRNVIQRIGTVADRLLGTPPPTPASGAVPIPVPDGVVRKIEDRVEEVRRLLSVVSDQLERLEQL